MVSDPPKQDKTYCQQTSYSLAIGDTKQICCPVSGYPPPFFTWKKNGVKLKGEDSVLTITVMGEEDFGNYTCDATDFSSTPLKPIYIPVKEKGNWSIGTDGMISSLKWGLKKALSCCLEQVGFLAWRRLAQWVRLLESPFVNKSFTSKQRPWASRC